TNDPPYNLLPGANSSVQAALIQPDGLLVIGGSFSAYNTVPRNRLARVTTGGSIDPSFLAAPLSGADNFVSSIVFDQNGKLFIGGGFGSFNGVNRRGVARINADGTLDGTFNPGSGASDPVRALARAFNGQLIVAGEFTNFNGLPQPYIVRLNTNGVVDTNFSFSTGPNGPVLAMAIQNNGSILIGGQFTSVRGVPRNHIARLNADGTVDLSFDPGSGADDAVQAITIPSDGRILIGGSFRNVGDTTRGRIA